MMAIDPRARPGRIMQAYALLADTAAEAGHHVPEPAASHENSEPSPWAAAT